MARALWRGAISFGLVNIPIRLSVAADSKDVSFRQLHREDQNRIRYLKWSPTLEREVQNDEIVRGYEFARDQYIIINDEELESLHVPSKHTVAILAFVDAAEIDPVYFEKTYTVEPDEAGLKPYALLLRAMQEKQLVAIGKIAIREKEHLCALRVFSDRLLLETLYFADEVREYDGPDVSGVTVSDSELAMASTLIDMLHQPFEPEQYHDEYRDALMAMITAKLEGGEVVAPPAEQPAAHTVDLMEALRASVEATRQRRGGTPGRALDTASEEARVPADESEEPPKRPARSGRMAAPAASRTTKADGSKTGSADEAEPESDPKPKRSRRTTAPSR